MPETLRLILASASPRRRQLLAEAGFDFDVVVPPIPEPDRVSGKLTPPQQAEALAYFKARAVAQEHQEALVLAADTIVALRDEILGKPIDRDEARRMLRILGGTRHAVTTGVALLGPAGERLIASETTYVRMRRMTDRQLDAYIASGEWAGKAGAYAIQETADRFVETVEGSFTNVVGLPVKLVARMIKELRRYRQTHKVS